MPGSTRHSTRHPSQYQPLCRRCRPPDSHLELSQRSQRLTPYGPGRLLITPQLIKSMSKEAPSASQMCTAYLTPPAWHSHVRHPTGMAQSRPNPLPSCPS